VGYSLGAAVTRLLAVEAEERMWTQVLLSARTGISQPQLSRAFRGTRVLTLDEMAAVCDALGLNLLAVIREAQQR
jgi:DNA-binding phage protein